MDGNIISVLEDDHKNANDIVNNIQYPPFGEPLDFNKLNRHAISLCPTLIINNVNGTVIVKRNKADKATDGTIKSGDQNKLIDDKSKSETDLKKARVKQKKPKKSRIVAEYQASQIPDNKGSVLSIDDLVKYVNGSEHCRNKINDMGYRLNNSNNNKCDKKHKTVITNKQTSNGKIPACLPDPTVDNMKDDHGYSIIDQTNSNLQTKSLMDEVRPLKIVDICGVNTNELDCMTNNDRQDCFPDNDFDNNAFFQVVRRKSRHKKSDIGRSSSSIKTRKENMAEKLEKSSRDLISVNSDNMLINDKESLNIFINKLWIEFQSCYQEYIRNESKRISETESY